MFEKKVLIEQIDDRIRRGIAVFLHIYSRILSDSAEDEEKRGNERVQNLINEYNKIIDDKLKEKEKDLMTI